ncbi:MAG: 16S rRNA (cytidine(1402)-2'-O)-methyltransferase, partial [Gammaproteobacteria bacterium]|nr:16S rRNA (cytidine(1402)-2'-O)-methyltransferase [Gammaproteobacteria bacterium]
AKLATLADLQKAVADGEIVQKGELVVVVAGTDEPSTSSLDVDRLLAELAGKLPDKEIAKALANATGEKRNALYKRLLDL